MGQTLHDDGTPNNETIRSKTNEEIRVMGMACGYSRVVELRKQSLHFATYLNSSSLTLLDLRLFQQKSINMKYKLENAC